MFIPGFLYFYLAVFSVDLLATTGDSHATWTSPIIPKLRSNDSNINPLGRVITADEESWLGSLPSIGAIISPFFYGFLSSRYGRRYVLLSIAIPHFVAYVSFAFAKNIYVFYVGRVLGGLAVGGGYTMMPLYISEVTNAHNRGFFSVILNVFWTFGNLIPYIIGPYVSIMVFNLILSCLPLIFVTLFSISAPETPYFLVEKNKIPEAEKSLARLRHLDASGIQNELQEIRDAVEHEEHGTYYDLVKTREMRKATFISLTLMIAQQMSGINAVLAYLQPIFDATGAGIPSDLASIACGLTLFTTSFIPPFLADRLGRRILLICSCFGMVIPLAGLGTFFYLLDETDYNVETISWLPILSIVVYIFFFNFGIGPLPWTVSSEVFPTSVKSEAASIVAGTSWFCSFIIMKFFNDMNDAMGRDGTFWFYSASSFAAGLFSIFFVPETKGKTFSEIQKLL